VAKLLGTDDHEVFHLKNHHGLPGYYHGGKLRFDQKELSTWMVDIYQTLKKEDFSAVKKNT
jgi:hypothetical protein